MESQAMITAIPGVPREVSLPAAPPLPTPLHPT